MEKRFGSHHLPHPSESPQSFLTSHPSSSPANHAHYNHQLIRGSSNDNNVSTSSVHVQNPCLIENLGLAFFGLNLGGYDRRRSFPFPPPPVAAHMCFPHIGNGPLIKELLADLQALNQARHGANFLELGASQIGIDSTGHLGGNFGNSGRPDSMLRVPSFGFGPGGLLREDDEHQCWKPDCWLHKNSQSVSHRAKQLLQCQQRVQCQKLTGVSCSNSCDFSSDANNKYMQSPRTSATNMKFEDAKEEEIEMVLSELIEIVDELMTDPFANYLFQKLVERIEIPSSKTQSVCGRTRSVQKLLTHHSNQEQISLALAALRPGVVALIKDLNGHHVIQHCLNYFSAKENEAYGAIRSMFSLSCAISFESSVGG
ncbi:hypothetical protein Ancab_028963 [Ancistrocladus abbreviatus]